MKTTVTASKIPLNAEMDLTITYVDIEITRIVLHSCKFNIDFILLFNGCLVRHEVPWPMDYKSMVGMSENDIGGNEKATNSDEDPFGEFVVYL